MKTVLVTAFCTMLSLGAISQQINPYPRTITVTGTAEMDIVPDEIYVQVNLKEYERKGSGKMTIDKIRQNFLSAVRSLGLPDSAISVASYGGNNWHPWWRKKNKKDELYASITYQVVLRTTSQVDQLVDKLDDQATENFWIQKTSHSKLEEFRRRLKMEAVKEAKVKADYLAGAINENVGVAVSINEPHEFYQPYYGNMRAMEMKMDDGGQQGEPQADFKKMKMRYDVTVVFALK